MHAPIEVQACASNVPDSIRSMQMALGLHPQPLQLRSRPLASGCYLRKQPRPITSVGVWPGAAPSEKALSYRRRPSRKRHKRRTRTSSSVDTYLSMQRSAKWVGRVHHFQGPGLSPLFRSTWRPSAHQNSKAAQPAPKKSRVRMPLWQELRGGRGTANGPAPHLPSDSCHGVQSSAGCVK